MGFISNIIIGIGFFAIFGLTSPVTTYLILQKYWHYIYA